MKRFRSSTTTKSRASHAAIIAVCAGLLLITVSCGRAQPQSFDIVLANGRVMDPESGLDGVRHVGITDGRIAAISETPLEGTETIDVAGLVVAPGFIDLHAHGQDPFTIALQARDGVTTALEMEGGVFPVAEWYEERQGKALINYGAGVSHPGARFEVMEVDPDPEAGLGDFTAWSHETASPEQIAAIAALIDEGLSEGAIGIGFGVQYTPAATREEIWRMYQVGAEHGVTGFAHVRFASMAEPGSSVEAVQEMIAIAGTGASVHVCHLPSTSLGHLPLLAEMIDAAREQGLDISTEAYPYTASSSFIGAAILDPGWRERLGRDYGDIAWAATGERLTAESFARYRAEDPNGKIIAHVMDDDMVEAALAHPDVMIAGDGGDLSSGSGHPRGAGTHARVLGLYSREKGTLTLMDAVRKMTLLPAQRLEAAVPQMRNKGRISVGADADLTIFDPEQVIDRATFDNPVEPSTGIPYVLVAGTLVVRNSAVVENVAPGQPIRREVR